MFGLADNDCGRSGVCLIGFVLICFFVCCRVWCPLVVLCGFLCVVGFCYCS